MFEKIRHWFTPHHTNNYRAQWLHHSHLTLILVLVLVFNFSLVFLHRLDPHILGFSSSITVDEVVLQTNQQRLSHGLPALKISQQLTQAAQAKAQYMFAHDFWAHIAPDGTLPWKFILDAGYNYLYAGENLAKDFSNTPNMIQAWMDSPTHRDNIISPKYQDIGVAVVPGRLLGKDTVLVVQMFGTRKSPIKPKTKTPSPNISLGAKTATPAAKPPLIAQLESPSTPSQPINPFNLSKLVDILLLFFLIIVLIVDLVLAESQNLSRRVGKNWAHIIFLNVVLIAVTLIRAGNIL